MGPPRPRRKRVDRGESSISSNGITNHSDHSLNNGNYAVNHNGEDDSSSSATPHCNKSNRTNNGKGARVVARRKRIQSRRKQKRLRTLVQRGIYIATFSFLLYCCIQVITLQRSGVGPTISNSSTTKQTNSESFPIANNKLNDGNGEIIINKHPNNEEYERRLLSKIPNHNNPLTEEEEQDILKEAHDELNQFPISIGTDDNGNNLDWEIIQHPGSEAVKFFTGNAPRKKRPTAQDIAGVLSGKKLRGADNNDNLGDGSDNSTDEGYMRVPKFWDPLPYRIIADEREKRSGITAYRDLPRDGVRRYLGNFGSRIMTPIEAKSIASRIPSSTDNSELLETIFVAIASYRDFQCSHTVDSAFSRATHPERIRVGVVDQIRLGEDKPCSRPPNGPCEFNANQPACKYQSQIDYFTVDAELSVGPVFARHLGHRLYRGEYFAVQSDAHVEFVLGWDDEIIEQWHTAKNEMAVLSTYLSGTEKHIDVQTGKRISKARPIMCESDFEGQGDLKHLRHGQQPEGTPYIHDMPTLNPFWAAGFSFGRGHFVVNIPYDQHLPWIFQGEEISIGLRGFS